MEQHAIVGDDFVAFFKIARAALRIAATQVTRWQHRLHTNMPQHGLRGQTDLGEQPF